MYGPAARALALLAWQNGLRDEQRQSLARRARAARQMAILPADRAALPQLQTLYGVRLQAVELGEGQWATVVRPEAGADMVSMSDRAAP